MVRKLLNTSFSKVSPIIGVHIQIQPTGEYIFCYVQLSKKHSNIKLDHLEEYTQISIDELLDRLPANVPIFLSIDGRGVLSKKIKINADVSLVQLVMPNSKSEEFWVDGIDGENGDFFASVIRTETLDSIINVFGEHKRSIIGLTIGPFYAASFAKYLESIEIKTVIGQYSIMFSDDKSQMTDCIKLDQATESIYIEDGINLNSYSIIPYLHSVSYYCSSEKLLSYQPISALDESFHSKKLFDKLAIISLVLLLILLCVNFIFYSKLSEQKSRLDIQADLKNEQVKELKKLKEELEWKENFLNQTGLKTNSRFSFYADRIGQTVPSQIFLDRIELSPITGKLQNSKEIELRSDVIEIDGNTSSNKYLNDWITKLKEYTWIRNVNLIEFFKDETYCTFSIEVLIANTNQK